MLIDTTGVFPDPETAGAQADLQAHVAAALATVLTERERRVLTRLDGLADGVRRTLAEVAGELGVSRERVRQIEEEAFSKLRQRPDLAQAFADYC